MRKKIVEMFTDEPMLQVRVESSNLGDQMEEDDHDISLVLAKSRQKNIELLRKQMQAEEESYEDVEMKGGHEPTGMVISGVSDFLSTVKRPERQKRAKVLEREEEILDANVSVVNVKDRVEIGDESLDAEDEDDVGFGDEPLVSKGVGSTLAFLCSRGKGLKINVTKEPFNFSDVQIKYHDEFGNVITSKEAYKQLSHRFHGKTPGKNKEEKRLKKMAEGTRMRKASMSGDGSAALQRSRQKESGESHIMLAKGNKASEAPEPAKRNAEKRPLKQQPVPFKKPKIFGML